MSKSRRDLSLVAIAALVASSFAMAAPAQAAGELKIEPVSGSGFAVPHQDVFDLKVSATAGNDSDELENLKFLIETDGDTIVTTGTTREEVTKARLAGGDDDVVFSSGFEAADDTVATLSITARAGDNSTDATTRITVTAFVDKNESDTADNGEWEVSQEITYYAWDEVTFSNVLTQPVLGDTDVETTISDANINLLQSSLVVDFAEDNTSNAAVASGSTARTYSATRDELGFSAPYTVAGSKAYSAEVYWSDNAATDAANRLTGTKSTRAVGDADIDNITGEAVRTDFSPALDKDSTSANIKSGSGSFEYVVEVSDSGDPVEDQTVSLVISEESTTSLGDGEVTVGSATLSNDSSSEAEKLTATGTSDADGEVTFVVSYSGLDKDDSFQIQAVSDGLTEKEITLTAVDSAVTQVVSADVIADDEQLVKATDSAFSLTYHVLDQFGALYTGTDATVSVNDGTNDYTGSVVNGAATVSMPSYDSANDGALTMTATVSTTGGGDTADGYTHTVFVGSTKAEAAVTVAASDFGTATAPLDLNTNKTATADGRFANYTVAAENTFVATASVKEANGNSTRSQVTFSGENLIFGAETLSTVPVVRSGSITVWTDSNGEADVSVSSQRSGKQVLTVTAGGASKTQDIYFKAPAQSAGTSLELDMPATAAPGGTFQVTGTLTDFFGNPVSTATDRISVKYDGPGIPVGTLPNRTDADGQFKFGVLLGTNDTGTGTVTASYDQDGDGNFTDDKDIVREKSINDGAAEGPFTGTYGDVTAWTVNQGDGTAKVYVKFPPVGEKLRILHQTGGSGSYTSIYADTTESEDMDGLRQVAGVGTYVVRTIDLADGTNRIRVSLDGEDIEVNGKDRPARYNE